MCRGFMLYGTKKATGKGRWLYLLQLLSNFPFNLEKPVEKSKLWLYNKILE